MPPRKRMRWKQPAPSGSGQSPANLAAEPMCFRGAKELQSELLAMLDQPDDAIRFDKDDESNEKENKLAQTLIAGVLHSLHFQFTARCNRRCLLIAIVTPVGNGNGTPTARCNRRCLPLPTMRLHSECRAM